MKNKSNNQHNGKLDNFYQAQKVPVSVRAIRFYFKRLGWMFPERSAKLFWNLFTSPRKRTVKDWHQAFLNTADEKSIFSVDEHKYVTYTWGNGPKTIVLLHGWEGMAVDYKNLIEALLETGEYKIVAFDFPAHGTAPGKNSNLAVFIKGTRYYLQQQGEIYAILGHSLGASAAFFTLAELKESIKVEHLIMLGSYPIPFHFFKTFQAFMQIPHSLFEYCVDYAENLIGVRVRKFNMYEMRYNIPAKSVLMIHDIHDEVADIEKAKALAAEWSDATLFIGNHGGHYKHFRHAEVVEKIVGFLKQPAYAAASSH